jgi:hypothetical protein
MPFPRPRRTPRRLLLAAAGLALLAGLFAARVSTWRHAHDTDLVRLFGGRDGLALVSRFDRVEAARLAPIPRAVLETPKAFDHLANFPDASPPFAVPGPTARGLAAVLASPLSDGWDPAPAACGAPTPGVRLAFVRGGERLDVLLCFRCEVVLLYRDGRKNGVEDLERSAIARLIPLIKPLFPDDPVIQSLDRPGHPIEPV